MCPRGGSHPDTGAVHGFAGPSGLLLRLPAPARRLRHADIRPGHHIERRDISFWSLKQIPEVLDALGRKAVAALGLRERWFHLEFFRLPEDRFIAIEANLRPPGGFMTDMLNYACDIDVYRYTPKYHVCHIARRAGRPYRHSHEEVVRRPGPTLMMHITDMPGVYQAAMGTEMYLTRHADLERMHEDVRFVQATQ